ncbi:MAG: response regulator [Deltaproteobacteria bacterium]|nr:response regulator [Deltaproteobacteria bacterium]
MDETRPRILCVDDEPLMLESLQANLRRAYVIFTATDGKQGLNILKSDGPFAVVLSDMRMPVMDGAAFLTQVRKEAPDTVRLLLTGQADVAAAIAAVNEGQVFRFLTKPCPPSQLLTAIQMAVNQYSLVTAEKVLLEQTLRGSIKALIDVLSLSNPQTFGRATRIKKHVQDLARRRELSEIWPLEVAAMLSQIGYVALPPETVEKLYNGQDLDAAEQASVARLPAIADQLLEDIPRLEVVRGIIQAQARPRVKTSTLEIDDIVSLGAEILRIAIDFDRLETSGAAEAMALSIMKGRGYVYDPLLLDVFISLRTANAKLLEVRELKLSAIKVGMVLSEDVRMKNGALLAARGHEVTRGFVERVRSFGPDMVREPVRVIVSSAKFK